MRKIFQILLLATLLIIPAVIASAESLSGFIEVEGIVYYEQGMSPNQMRRMSIMDAYRYLAEQIDALYVTSNSTVKDLRNLDEQINTRVEAALRGAKVISVTRESDGSFHAIVRMPIYGGVQSLSAAVLKENVVVEDFPPPKFTNIHSEINYTGLIVDCRGLNLSQAIIPTIKSDDGTEIYAYKNVGYRAATDKGMVEYSSSLDSSRAGNSPLVVKAVKVSNKCDVLISSADGDKILSANQVAKFLENCAVVFVR